MITNFFSPLSFVTVFGSGIRDPKSGVRDPGWVKIRIRDKYPGSATLVRNSLKILSPGCGLLAFGAADFPTSSTFSTFSCKEKEYLNSPMYKN
jgi:hypothetical protein